MSVRKAKNNLVLPARQKTILSGNIVKRTSWELGQASRSLNGRMPNLNDNHFDRMINRISQIHRSDSVPIGDQAIDYSSEEYQQSLVDAVKEASKRAEKIASDDSLMIKTVSNVLSSFRKHHHPHLPHDFHFPHAVHNSHESNAEHNSHESHAEHEYELFTSDLQKAFKLQPKLMELAGELIDPEAINMMVFSRVCTRLTHKVSPQLCTAVGNVFHVMPYLTLDLSMMLHPIAMGFVDNLSPSNKVILGATCLIVVPLITTPAAAGCLMTVAQMSTNRLIFDGIIAVFNQFADNEGKFVYLLL